MSSIDEAIDKLARALAAAKGNDEATEAALEEFYSHPDIQRAAANDAGVHRHDEAEQEKIATALALIGASATRRTQSAMYASRSGRLHIPPLARFNTTSVFGRRNAIHSARTTSPSSWRAQK